MELQRDEGSIFADDAVFENGVGGEIDYDRGKVYVGTLADTPTGTDHAHMSSAKCSDFCSLFFSYLLKFKLF